LVIADLDAGEVRKKGSLSGFSFGHFFLPSTHRALAVEEMFKDFDFLLEVRGVLDEA
jgi:hypothetical protein